MNTAAILGCSLTIAVLASATGASAQFGRGGGGGGGGGFGAPGRAVQPEMQSSVGQPSAPRATPDQNAVVSDARARGSARAVSGAEPSTGARGVPARANPLVVGRDATGGEVVSREIVVLLDRGEAGAFAEAGLDVLASTPLAALGGALVRLRLTRAADTAVALERLGAGAGAGSVAAANHVYRAAAAPGGADAMTSAQLGAPKRGSLSGLVGMIDGAVESQYPGLAAALSERRAFGVGPAADAGHGTAVADILARGAMRIVAADVFTRDTRGAGAAATDAIIRALDWLVSRGVRVINISLEGPADDALAEAIRRAQARGALIVAAAGNRGAAAAPSYPAAFAGVVAVTAIDRADRPYRYANHGDYITVAALGVDVDTARLPAGRRSASGTSFAAPVVAAFLARLPISADPALDALRRTARHLGAAGRNSVYGFGAIDVERVAEAIGPPAG